MKADDLGETESDKIIVVVLSNSGVVEGGARPTRVNVREGVRVEDEGF
jgi:hypothetical protein